MPTQNVEISVVLGRTCVDIFKNDLSIKMEDEIAWHTHQTHPFTVTFDNGTPFASATFTGSKGRPAHSGPAVNANAGQDYKYVVTVQGAVPLDPVVHTDP